MDQCIRDYIARLPENYRVVFALVDSEGLRNDAIAEILGMTLDIVKIRLHRARQRLKEEINENCPWRKTDIHTQPELEPQDGKSRYTIRRIYWKEVRYDRKGDQ